MEPIERHSGRVVFVDREGRALLQRVLDEDRGTTFWLTTGGGIDTGESVIDAVIREAREESGYVIGPELLGAPVAIIDTEWSFRGSRYAGVDTLFFLRVDHFEVDPSGQDEIEQAIILEWRWWTETELKATSDRVEPSELAELLGSFLRGQLPGEPVHLSSFTPVPGAGPG